MLNQVLRALAGRFNVNVNVSFGINGGFEPTAVTDEPTKGRIVQLPVGPFAADKQWADAEQGEKERFAANVAEEDKHPEVPNPVDPGLMTGAAAVKLKTELLKTNFRGTVGQQTLIDKALKLGLPEVAGTNLWNLLDTSKELRNLCDDHGVDFPPLGENNMFRRADLRKLAKLEGVTGVPGFGSRSRAYKVLRAL